jgi:recombination protein RecR
MPRALDELIEAFSSLPGIGRKSAARLAFFLLKRPVEDSRDIAERIIKARESLKPCKICGNLTDNAECDICRDTSRNRSLICVVEEPSDVTAIESIGEYRGLYHVLGGSLSPLDGVGPDDLNISSLKKRIGDEPVEIILATDLTTEGEATASYLLSVLPGKNVKISRIARGLPAGGSLEYADKNTLARALENRTKLDK